MLLSSLHCWQTPSAVSCIGIWDQMQCPSRDMAPSSSAFASTMARLKELDHRTQADPYRCSRIVDIWVAHVWSHSPSKDMCILVWEHFLGVQVASLLTEEGGWTCVKMYEGFVLIRYVKMTDLETTALNEIFGTCSFQEKEPHCAGPPGSVRWVRRQNKLGWREGEHCPEPMLWFLQKGMGKA